MKKQLPVYGAILLTAMVVMRAITMEKDLDLSDQYQRQPELLHVENNTSLRNTIAITDLPVNTLLAEVKKQTNNSSKNRKVFVSAPPVNLVEDVSFIMNEEFALLEEIDLEENEEDLSLDRESTINTRISLLFSRQRILPKPSSGSLEN